MVSKPKGANLRRNVTDVTKYPREGRSVDEGVSVILESCVP